MVLKNTPRIVDLRSSEHFQQIKQRLLNSVLRCQNVDLEDLRYHELLNKIYQANSAVQVVNLLGYALNKPMPELNAMEAKEKQRWLRTGDICLVVEEKSRRTLNRVVAKMASFWFTLIPLVIVIDPKNPNKTFETVLIKVYRSRGPSCCNYVDMCGRVYESFQQFLENNTLPFSIVCYPESGLISFDVAGDIVVECADVGVRFGRRVSNRMDAVIGIVRATSTVGSFFIGGGLGLLFWAASLGSTIYATNISIRRLIASSKHGMSLNPFGDMDTRNNWLMILANLLTFVLLGWKIVVPSKVLSLMHTYHIITSVHSIAIVDSTVYLFYNRSITSIKDWFVLAGAVCFYFQSRLLLL